MQMFDIPLYINDMYCDKDEPTASTIPAKPRRKVSHQKLPPTLAVFNPCFGVINEEEARQVAAGGKRKREAIETWAATAFDLWRTHCGYNTARKQDGTQYPPSNVSNLLREINCLIRPGQEMHSMETGVSFIPINIL